MVFCLGVALGIDAKGGTDPGNSRVEWTIGSAPGAWKQLVVETYANAPAVTVFLRADLGYRPDYPGQCNWAVRNNWGLFDAVELTTP